MKKGLLTLVGILFYLMSFGQEYPFSVQKTGEGGQAIVFIPGFASSGDVWDETVAALKSDYTCYVLTMAGFAGEKPEDNPTFENWKSEIARYIADEKMEKPIIVGHSMGGGLALAIASDYPDVPGKIVVVDALPSLMALSQPDFKSNPNNDCTPMVDQMTQMSDANFEQMQNTNVGRLSTNEAKHNEIVAWSLSTDRETFAKMYCDFSNTDLRGRLTHATAPALILLEPYFKNMESIINEQYKNLHNAELKYATKGLHFVMYDDTAWYLNQIQDFIKE